MHDFVPRGENLNKEWVKVSMSIISRTLVELSSPRYFFGTAKDGPPSPVGAAVFITEFLERSKSRM